MLVERIGETSANLGRCLDRFRGLHILVFSSPAIDEAAARLTAAGVNTVRRAAPRDAEIPVETVRHLEIDGDEPGAGPGAVAECRVGVVADLDPDARGARRLDHPDGAVELVGAMLCVAGLEMAAVQQRYEAYLGRSARQEGPAQVFDLDGAALTLVPDSDLATFLPGERPRALPALVGCTVVVRDLALTCDLLRRNGLPVRETPSGDMFVPADAALGTAVVFRSAARPTADWQSTARPARVGPVPGLGA